MIVFTLAIIFASSSMTASPVGATTTASNITTGSNGTTIISFATSSGHGKETVRTETGEQDCNYHIV